MLSAPAAARTCATSSAPTPTRRTNDDRTRPVRPLPSHTGDVLRTAPVTDDAATRTCDSCGNTVSMIGPLEAGHAATCGGPPDEEDQ